MSENEALSVALRTLNLKNAADKALIVQVGSADEPASEEDIARVHAQVSELLKDTGLQFLVTDHKPTFRLRERPKRKPRPVEEVPTPTSPPNLTLFKP